MTERVEKYRKLAENAFDTKGQFRHFYPAGDRWILGLAGAVEIVSKELFVKADNVIVWVDREKYEAEQARVRSARKGEEETAAEPGAVETPRTSPSEIPRDAVEEIYADGDVSVELGRERVRCERFYVDLRCNKAIFIDGTLSTYQVVRGRVVPLSLRAEEIRQLGDGYFVATEASVSNCTFGEPHWHLQASEVTLDTRSPGAALYRADNVSYRVGELPVFWLPFIQGDLSGGSNFYFKGAQAGKSTQFGWFAKTDWGDEIRIGHGKDAYSWGDWTLHLDPLQRRGMGVGLDLDYDTTRHGTVPYFGRFRSYYIHDTGDEDKNDQPIEERDRGRVRLQHREYLPFGVEGTAEISYLSDKNFLNEYFEDEAKTGKEQETDGYLKKVWDDQALTLLGKWRINDFQTTTEYLPQLGYRALFKPLLPGMPLGTNLYFTDETQVANVRFAPSDDLPALEARQTTRFDTRNQLNVPVSFGDFNLNPFVEGRYTVYGEAQDADSQDGISRVTAASGFRLGTALWRTYDKNIRAMRVQGIRHVINPEVLYVNRWAVTQPPEDLIQFDDVDGIGKTQFVELSVRNRLETRAAGRTRTFLDWRTANRLFPDADRDNLGKPAGDLENDVQAILSQRLRVFWDSQYDWTKHAFDVMNTGVLVSPNDDVRAALSHRFLRDLSSIITADVEYRLSEKWTVEMREQYDIEVGRQHESQVVVQRFTHDWVFEFNVSVDNNEGNTSISVAFFPRQFYSGARKKRKFDNAPYFDSTLPVPDGN